MVAEKRPVILTIDDEAVIRSSFRNFLEDLDYTVFEAENGRVGLEVFKREKPDLILVDLRMPEVDGLDVLAKVNEINSDTPIIVVSGTGVINDAVEALHRGAWDYILKPVEDLVVLQHSVEKGLERARFIRENRAYQEHLEEEVARRTGELESANLDLQRLNTRLRSIVQSTNTLTVCSRLSQLGEMLLVEFAKNMTAEGGSLYLRAERGYELIHTLDPGHAPETIPFPLPEGSICARLIRERKPILIEDLRREDGLCSSDWGGYRDGSLLAFPLPEEKARETSGLLFLHNKITPPFSQQDLELGAILASYSHERIHTVAATEELQRREERYRNIFESILDAYSEVSIADGIILELSPSIKEISGYEREELLGKSIFDYYSQPGARTELLRALKEKSYVNDYEIHLRNKAGKDIACSVSVRLSPDEDGNPSTIVGTLRDISERKRVEEAMYRQSEALEQSPDGITISDLEGHLQFGNSAWAKMHGYTAEELPGQSLLMFHTDEQIEKEMMPFMAKVKERGGFSKEIWHMKKNGSVFPAMVSASVLCNELGEPIGLIMIAHDNTDQRSLEAQLFQAQKMESVGRLAGGIAHDFNNLLSPILGYSEILLSEFPADDPRSEDLQEILNAANRARDLNRQLLAFSRKQVLEMKIINLNKVVSDFEKILQRTVRDDIELMVNLEDNLWNVYADVSQLEQIIMNLVVNAQDAMPRGGQMSLCTRSVTVDVAYAESHPGMEPGNYVALEMCDSGEGIDEEKLQRIFDPFFTTKEQGKGTGLGLATVHGIVKQHNGHISVQSKVGQGSVFTILLPEEEGVAISTESGKDKAIAEGGSETILVVEDSESVCALVCSILRKYGYNVLVAHEPDEACKVVEDYTDTIHLLLTDVVMPQMNGKELFEHLHAFLGDLKVIYTSGYTSDVIAKHGILDKSVDFVQKPVSVRILAKTVREVLDR
jgi:PAS domain S-box-containing protein